MSTKTPSRMNLSVMQEIVSGSKDTLEGKIFLSEDFGVSMFGDKVLGMLNEKNIIGKPFILEDTRMAIITSGSVEVSYNLLNFHIEAGDMFCINSGSLVQINSSTPDFAAKGIVISKGFLEYILNNHPLKSFAEPATYFILHLEDDSRTIINNLFLSIWLFVKKYGLKHNSLNLLISSLLSYVDMLHSVESKETLESGETSRVQVVFEKFINLLSKNVDTRRTIAFYADQICLSPRHFNLIIQQNSGSTVKEWIDRATIIRAKALLLRPDLNVDQVSNTLNFANTSFFCKYFKRLTHMTPNEYKKHAGGN